MFDDPITQAFATLALAVAAIAIIFWLLKKYSKKISPKLGNKNIDIKSRSSLTPKSHLYIVEVEGEKLLLGVTENSVNLIKELKIKDENTSNGIPDNLKLNSEKDDISFKSFLKQAVLKK